MADTVDVKVVLSGTKYYILHLTNISDGTGESAVIKADISGLIGANGLAPTGTSIREVAWSIQGFTSVRLFWDHTTDDEIVVLGTGSGILDFSGIGGLVDPRSAGGTGDILLTTAGAAAGSTYDITLVIQLKN